MSKHDKDYKLHCNALRPLLRQLSATWRTENHRKEDEIWNQTLDKKNKGA